MQDVDAAPLAQDAPIDPGLLIAALDAAGSAMLVLDSARRVAAVNTRFAEMFALPASVRRPGTNLDTLLAAPMSDDIDGLGARTIARPGREVPASFQRLLTDGRTIAVRWSSLATGGWACICDDVTERRRSEKRLEHVVRHDALTGLRNRLAFREGLQRLLLRTAPGEDLAVLLIDLNRFREANDALGPRVGDLLLQEVATRLVGVLRQGELLARLGSDEFALVLTSMSGADLRDDAAAAGRRAVEALARPFDVADARVVIGAGVGIATADSLTPGDAPSTPGDDADALLHNARLAVYRAKEEGREPVQFYTAAMDEAVRARMALEMDLREALAQGQFELFYQPQINVGTRAVAGFEALIRWRHPVRGLVPPDHFIPLAEELGLIVPIGAWALREACRTAVTWPLGPAGAVKVAVNLSAVQFRQPDLAETVAIALRESGLPGALLDLEVTESILLQDGEDTAATLARLRALGVNISLDDFGTGYSSLSYLNSFPFDKLKIDKSFVQAMNTDTASPARDVMAGGGAAAIVRAIAGLGASLGIATTAEGVESRAQLDMLVAYGCTEMQGYLFSPPRPAGEVPGLIEAAARHAA